MYGCMYRRLFLVRAKLFWCLLDVFRVIVSDDGVLYNQKFVYK